MLFAAGIASAEEIDLSQLEVGFQETATRYLAAAQEGPVAMDVADVAQPNFAEPYLTPFGTSIERLTESFHSNHTYSQLQAVSYDSRYILLSEDVPTESSAKDVVRRLEDGFPEVIASPIGVWGNPRWHPGQAAVLVHFDSNTDEVLRWQETDPATGETLTVFTFPPEYQRYLKNQSFDELSRDGRFVAGQAVGVGDWSRIFSLDLTSMALAAEIDPAALYAGPCTEDPEFGPLDPDWVGVSPLGNYLIVQWAAAGPGRCEGLESYDIETGAYVGHVADGHPHADMTVLADGTTEVFVTNELSGPAVGESFVGGEPAGAEDRSNPALAYRELPGPATGESAVHYLYSIDYGGFEHISCRGPQGFCLVTGYPSPENGARDPLEDEIYLIQLDGGGVTRLAHHHSSGADYYSQPRATFSADGRYVVFDSDWDDPQTTYAFLIRLPEPAMSHGAALIVIAILALCRRRLGEEPGRRQPEGLSRTGCP